MATRMRDCLTAQLDKLTYEPIEKRIRAMLGDETVLDSTRACLIWEPQRVVPSYAVPDVDIRGDLVPTSPAAENPASLGFMMPDLSSRPILDPSVPFRVHTARGEPLELHGRDAFRLVDPELAGYVAVDFDGFDAWYEEDERNSAHPRSPFHRIDVLPSSRRVRIEIDGHLLAESERACFLFETLLPPRFYLPREDVCAPLQPSAAWSVCAYKGEASYWSPEVDGQVIADLAWSYEEPRNEIAGVKGRVAFFNERVDVTVDGLRRDRPTTPWSEHETSSSHASHRSCHPVPERTSSRADPLSAR